MKYDSFPVALLGSSGGPSDSWKDMGSSQPTLNHEVICTQKLSAKGEKNAACRPIEVNKLLISCIMVEGYTLHCTNEVCKAIKISVAELKFPSQILNTVFPYMACAVMAMAFCRRLLPATAELQRRKTLWALHASKGKERSGRSENRRKQRAWSFRSRPLANNQLLQEGLPAKAEVNLLRIDPSGPAKVPAYVEVQTAQQSSATVSGVQVEMAESTSHVFVVMGASVRVFLKPLSRIQGSSGMTHLLLIK